MKYSIIIPTYNHLEDGLKPCVDSVLKHIDLDDAEIIIVSNGSTDGTREYLNNLPKGVRYLWFDEPLGFSKAVNRGIEAAKGRYIVLLNNDTTFFPQEKNYLLNALTIDDNTITGPLMRPVGGKSFLIFFCVLIPKKVIDRVGLLDEAFGMGGQEDVDYCIRAIKAGFKIKQIPPDLDFGQYAEGPLPIYHRGELTVHDSCSWEQYQNVFARNIQLVSQKHFDYFAMTGSPQVGIIMPVIDLPDMMEKSLEGILNQFYPNWTLYLVDNLCSGYKTIHSPDPRFTAFLKRPGDLLPRIIHSKLISSRPLSEIKNYALKEIEENSDIEYIAFCDPRDVWNPNHLKESIIFLQATNGEICYSDVDCYCESGQPFRFYGPKVDFLTCDTLKNRNWIYTSTVLMKKNLGYFNEDFEEIEDWHYWLRLLKENHTIYHLNRVHANCLARQQ